MWDFHSLARKYDKYKDYIIQKIFNINSKKEQAWTNEKTQIKEGWEGHKKNISK